MPFATWWGGLTFYSVVVVPIGSEQIGSTEQGFITQQVTWWHNLILAAMVVLLVIEVDKAIRRRIKPAPIPVEEAVDPKRALTTASAGS